MGTGRSDKEMAMSVRRGLCSKCITSLRENGLYIDKVH